MNKYFFPTLSLVPKFDEPMIRFGKIAVHRRLWDTSTFDLATLATKHTLHIPYQMMDVYLQHCNLEIEVEWDGTLEDLLNEVEIIRALLYLHGIAPFVMPFVTTYSVNAYSGINARDSEFLREKLVEGLKEGLTSDAGKVEAWYVDRTLQVIRGSGTNDLSAECWEAVSADLNTWKKVEENSSLANIARRILNSAPMIPDVAASILQIWQGIESLFPTVTSEVSFRVALLVAQLCAPLGKPRETYQAVRRAYAVRSKITHGSTSQIEGSDWVDAWSLLCLCLRSILKRGAMPSEKELMGEVFPL